ncbi:hypothetical protein QMT40_000233 [Parvibaculaceae bacterium PLY_AMNH_Bact1]|nr:hypothetical protein QMT40_000233 [Parvibaculaceae bacterium PLY_AMNH_Bact1]
MTNQMRIFVCKDKASALRANTYLKSIQFTNEQITTEKVGDLAYNAKKFLAPEDIHCLDDRESKYIVIGRM